MKKRDKPTEAEIAKLRELGRKHAKKFFKKKTEAYVMDVGFEDAMELLKEKNPLLASFVFEGMVEQRADMERKEDDERK